MKAKRWLSALLCLVVFMCLPYASAADPDLGVDDNPFLPQDIVIGVQPQSQNVVSGDTITLSVQAVSNPAGKTLTYQWFVKTGQYINLVTDNEMYAGTTTDTVTIITTNIKWCQTDGVGVFCRISDGKNTKDTEIALIKVAHVGGELIVDQAPTCSAKGSGHKACIYCETIVESNIAIEKDANAHTEGALIVDVKPTCTTDGKGHKECVHCGVTLQDNLVIDKDVNAHTAGELIVDQAPTCTTNGKGHKECIHCGITLQDNLVIDKDANAHTEGALIVDVKPTCTTDGKGHKECIHCGVTLQDNLVIDKDANAHTEGELIVDQAPTCTADGKGHKECIHCGITLQDNLVIDKDANAHTAGTLIVDQKPTCTANGKGHKECIRCGATVESNISIAKEGHDKGKWTTVKQPTATADGKQECRCTKCGALLDSKAIAKTGKNVVNVFKDLKKSDWYVKNGAIDFVYNQGLFSGLSPTTFGPKENMTRAMFVTVLGRLHGVKSTKAVTKFTDVKKSAYYSGYVAWANKNGIVSGLNATTFGPDNNINREQICAMMVRYCDFANIKLKKINKAVTFIDAKEISSYAKKAVTACQTGGIVGGEKAGSGYRFRPKGNATRAEVATIMLQFYNTYIK